MRFVLFGGLVTVLYTALAYARRFSAGCGGACAPEGLDFAFVASLEVVAAALIVSLGYEAAGAVLPWLPSARRSEPGLERVVGRRVREQNCAAMVADNAALHEAVLNP